MATCEETPDQLAIINDPIEITLLYEEPTDETVAVPFPNPTVSSTPEADQVQLLVFETSTELITDLAVGPQGIPGTAGTDGSSAYEIAVDNGFDGTEEEWLESLQGDDGAPADPEGYVVRIIAPSFIGGHRIVAFNNAGVLEYADKDNIQHANKSIGITLNAANPGDELIIRFSGEIEEGSWNWDWSLPLFLSTNGLMTQIPPTTGMSLVVAIPITPSKILINIKEPILLT